MGKSDPKQNKPQLFAGYMDMMGKKMKKKKKTANAAPDVSQGNDNLGDAHYEDVHDDSTPEYEDMAVYEIMEARKARKTKERTLPTPPEKYQKNDPQYVVPSQTDESTDSDLPKPNAEYQILKKRTHWSKRIKDKILVNPHYIIHIITLLLIVCLAIGIGALSKQVQDCTSSSIAAPNVQDSVDTYCRESIVIPKSKECYYIHNVPMTKAEAEMSCDKASTRLVEISSEDDLTVITNMIALQPSGRNIALLSEGTTCNSSSTNAIYQGYSCRNVFSDAKDGGVWMIEKNIDAPWIHIKFPMSYEVYSIGIQQICGEDDWVPVNEFQLLFSDDSMFEGSIRCKQQLNGCPPLKKFGFPKRFTSSVKITFTTKCEYATDELLVFGLLRLTVMTEPSYWVSINNTFIMEGSMMMVDHNTEYMGLDRSGSYVPCDEECKRPFICKTTYYP